MKLPQLPPSSNNMYIKTRGGGRALSPEGKRFREETKTFLSREYSTDLVAMKKDVAYHVWFRFYVPTLYNQGWGSGTARFKKFDATNRVKLVEDVLKDICGIDDSQNTIVVAEKVFRETEGVEIWIWCPETETSPIVRVELPK